MTKIYSIVIGFILLCLTTPIFATSLATHLENTWIPANTGLPNNNVLSFTHDSLAMYAGISRNGVYKSVNGGQTWGPANNGIPGNAAVWSLAYNSNALFAGTFENGIYKSIDGGKSWQPANKGITGRLSILSIYWDGTDTLYAGTTDGSYRSTDSGENWISMPMGEPKVSTPWRCFAHDPKGIVYYGSMWGIYKSLNKGVTWTKISASSLPKPPNPILALGLTEGTLYAAFGLEMGTNPKIATYKSSDEGKTWQQINGGRVLPQMTPTTFVFFGNKDVMYGGAPKDGVLKVANTNKTWSTANEGLPVNPDPFSEPRRIYAFGSDNDNNVYVSLESKGVFKRSLPSAH